MADLELMFGDDDQEDQLEISLRPKECGVLAFHSGTEEAMFIFVEASLRSRHAGISPEELPVAVLSAVDTFCYTRHWMMHVGDKKLKYIDQAWASWTDRSSHITNPKRRSHPQIVVEIGSYCGYSAVYIASKLKDHGSRMFCVEQSPACVVFTRRLLALAGLSDRVEVLEGVVSDVTLSALSTRISELRAPDQELSSSHTVDFLFIDHDKSKYHEDILRIESKGLLNTGSIVVADNVLSFGVPLTAYLEYVRDRDGPFLRSELFVDTIEYCDGGSESNDVDIVDGIEVSVHK